MLHSGTFFLGTFFWYCFVIVLSSAAMSHFLLCSSCIFIFIFYLVSLSFSFARSASFTHPRTFLFDHDYVYLSVWACEQGLVFRVRGSEFGVCARGMWCAFVTMVSLLN